MELGRQENQSFLWAKPEKHGQHLVRLMWEIPKENLQPELFDSTDSPEAVNSATEMDESWVLEKALLQIEHPALCQKLPK